MQKMNQEVANSLCPRQDKEVRDEQKNVHALLRAMWLILVRPTKVDGHLTDEQIENGETRWDKSTTHTP